MPLEGGVHWSLPFHPLAGQRRHGRSVPTEDPVLATGRHQGDPRQRPILMTTRPERPAAL